MQAAVGEWNGAILENSSPYPGWNYTYNGAGWGGGDYTITLANMDPSLWGQTIGSTIYINYSTLDQGADFFYSIVMHEVGHALDFSAVGDSCDTDSIMGEHYSVGGLIPIHLTTLDHGVIRTYYPAAPDWCNPTECSPVIIDIDGSGISLTGAEVYFRLNGIHRQKIGWTASNSSAGFLVLDRDGDGQVGSGLELFGQFTPLSWSLNGPHGIQTGFQALAWFDQVGQGGNADGMISSSDAVFRRLRVWVDVNHNGLSEPSELHSLQAVGVKALDLDVKSSRYIDAFGNAFRYRARVIHENGFSPRVTFAWDVFLTAE
ncbi:MAG: hypothetical protein U0Q11_04555 [Vicinamibacterales bacterium]